MTDNDTRRGRADATELRALLASADPAASLESLRADHLHRLKEQTMSTNSTRPTPTPDATPSTTRGVGRRHWVAAGVAGLGVAAAAAVIVANINGANGPAGPDDTPVTATSEFSQPAAAGAPAGACAEVTPEALAGYDTAFRADVTSIEDGKVTLAVDDRFAGEVEDTVITTQGTDSGVDGTALVFDQGATYLIAAQDDQIVTCGASGEQGPALDDVYRAAFAQ